MNKESRKRSLAVLDSDAGYVDRFLRYMKTKRSLPFFVIGFTSIASLKLYLERSSIDILLVSEEMLDVTLLTKLHEEPNIDEILIAGDKQDLFSRQKYINKYRSADRVLDDILSSCRVDFSEYTENGITADINMIGIYSPVCSPYERQLLGLALSRALTGSHSVLFIDLEAFSGITSLAGTVPAFSLSDLIYFFKTNLKKIREIMPQTVSRIENVDILFAPDDRTDIDLIESRQWKDFLKALYEAGSYDVIVFNMAESFRSQEEIFALCRNIFVPVTNGIWQNGCLREMKEYMRAKSSESIMEKIREVELSEEDTEHASDSDFLSVCLHGSIREKAEMLYFQYERGYA